MAGHERFRSTQVASRQSRPDINSHARASSRGGTGIAYRLQASE